MRGSFSSTLLALEGATCARELAAERRDFRVKVLTPGPVVDHVSNGVGYRALSVRDNLVAAISQVPTRTTASLDESDRGYGRR